MKNFKHSKIHLLFSVFLIINFCNGLFAQEDKYRDIRIGIMVQGKGKALYSWFGHAGIVLDGPSAILREIGQQHRNNFVHADSYTGEALLFDYGNFEIAKNNFIFRFLAGEVRYYKAYKSFVGFVERNALYQKRGVDVYWLNLDSEAKRRFAEILFRETNPENRVYQYDFYFDNCLTRIRDQLNEVFYGQLENQMQMPEKWSIRQMLRREIGEEFLLLALLEYLQGIKIDQPYSRWDSLFLPSYMPNFLSQLQVPDTNISLLEERENIFPFRREELANMHSIQFFRQGMWGVYLYAIGFPLLFFVLRVFSRQEKVTQFGKICIVAIYCIVALVVVLVLGLASGVLWWANIARSFDVAFRNVLVLLGSPVLFLQIPAMLCLLVPKGWGTRNMLWKKIRFGVVKFFSWNWMVHAWIALPIPVFAWLYSLLDGGPLQPVLLPWLLIFPTLAGLAFVPSGNLK